MHWCVHFNFVFMHLHWEQIIGQVHFTYRWNTSLARGSVVQIGGRHRHVGCCPDTRFEDTPFEMLIKCILSWRILSTPLVVCENNLIRTRSNIIGFVRFALVQPTDKACCQFFQPCRCLKCLSVANGCKLHCASTCSRIAYLENKGSTVWSNEYVEKSHGFAHCRAQICGDNVKRSFSLCFPLSRRSRLLRPDLEPRCDGNYSDGLWQYLYAPLCTSIHRFKWRILEGLEEMY